MANKFAKIKLFFLIVSVMGISACTTLPKSFQRIDDHYLHQPTGIMFPKSFSGWSIVDKGATENVSNDISAAISYKFFNYMNLNSYQPYITVYFFKNGSADNLKTIDERSREIQRDLRPLNSTRFELPNEAVVATKGYETNTAYLIQMGAVGVRGAATVETFFVQPAANQKLVFWITYNKNSPEEKHACEKFVESFISNN